jgi:hypothetical protein
VTPHLGASTREAQDKAGVTVAEMVRLALKGEFVPYAVNVSAGAEVAETVRPFVPLAEHLGALAAGLAGGGVRSVVASYLGRIAEHDTRVLTLATLKGILGRSVNEPVTFVNAPMLARDRGLTVSEMRSTVSQDYVSLVSIRAETDDGPIVVQGTIVAKDSMRVVSIDDFDVEVGPARRMVFFRYADRPGRGRRCADGAHGRLRSPGPDPGRRRRGDRGESHPRRHVGLTPFHAFSCSVLDSDRRLVVVWPGYGADDDHDRRYGRRLSARAFARTLSRRSRPAPAPSGAAP